MTDDETAVAAVGAGAGAVTGTGAAVCVIAHLLCQAFARSI